jgi:translation initiation factor eIF-2B subunit epsilon
MTRRHPESPLLLVHPPTNRLLHYTQHHLSPRQKRYAVPANLLIDPFPGIDSFEIWTGSPGYRDLGIDVCEADVPALCTENFDYHDLRRDFVNGVLTSELLGKKIAVYQVGAEDTGTTRDEGRYVDRVRDTRTFGDITYVSWTLDDSLTF